MDKVKIQESVDILMNQLNVMGQSNDIAEIFAAQLMNNHRTLQQNFWRNIQKVAEIYADAPSDLRNEGSVEFAKEITALDSYLPFV